MQERLRRCESSEKDLSEKDGREREEYSTVQSCGSRRHETATRERLFSCGGRERALQAESAITMTLLARYPGLLSGVNKPEPPVRKPNLHRHTAGVPYATGEETDVEEMKDKFNALRADIRENIQGLQDATVIVGENGNTWSTHYTEFDDQEEEESTTNDSSAVEPQQAAVVAPPPPGVLLAEHSENSPFKRALSRSKAPILEASEEQEQQATRLMQAAAFVASTPSRVGPTRAAALLQSPVLAAKSHMPPPQSSAAEEDNDLLESFSTLRDSLRGLMKDRYR